MNLERPLLTIIIPVFNESKTIKSILGRVQDVDISKEIIVVDDASSDNTYSIVESLNQPNIKLLRHVTNRGKGAAIQTAIPNISGQYIIIQDGDLEYDPQDFKKLMDVVHRTNARVVYGSRILSHSRMSYLRYWLGGRGVTFVTNMLFGSQLTDEPTCYKLIESELFRDLNVESVGFEFCPEVTGKILKRGIKIHEVPISYNPRSIEDGKKIRWKDGFIALWVLFKIRFPKLFFSRGKFIS